MVFYIESFIEAFGYKPVCAGCSFSSDWAKLARFVNSGEMPNKNKNIMSNTFKLKKVTNTILRYEIGGSVVRKYDNLMDEDFAIGFLTNGTPTQIEERKKLFAVLPAEKKKNESKETPSEVEEIEVVEEIETPEEETQTDFIVSTPKIVKSKKRNSKGRK